MSDQRSVEEEIAEIDGHLISQGYIGAYVGAYERVRASDHSKFCSCKRCRMRAELARLVNKDEEDE